MGLLAKNSIVRLGLLYCLLQGIIVAMSIGNMYRYELVVGIDTRSFSCK